jgi:uncharacterized membrane protein YhaH (DUF805 family)
MPALAEFSVGLFRWNGKAKRHTYALAGFIAFAIKHNIDRLIAGRYFPTGAFQLFNYLAPLGKAARLSHLTITEEHFLFALLAASLPFVVFGVGMTVQRLRDAGLPISLACLFFLPFLNLLFFLVLCFLPSKPNADTSKERAPWPHVRPLDTIIPRGKTAAELLSIGVSTVIGLTSMYVSTLVIGDYGWSLFVAVPFCTGLFAVLTYSYHEPRSLQACLSVCVLPIFLIGLAAVAVAFEGIICVLMAAPIALALAVLGGSLGYVMQAQHWGGRHKPAYLGAILLALPSALVGEHAAALRPPELMVRSAIEISAPPEQVWKQVVAFAEIAPPQELLFRAGVAYPIRAEIQGSGIGAMRHCIFSTGSFDEPITVWDEPHLLKFSVTHNPAPLNELTPYKNVHPPHLDGYFVSHGGQFLLTALPNGKTRVEGTTWYRDTMWPATYWSWWSDYVIHRIHMRVLTHIRQQSEEGVAHAVAAREVSSTR